MVEGPPPEKEARARKKEVGVRHPRDTVQANSLLRFSGYRDAPAAASTRPCAAYLFQLLSARLSQHAFTKSDASL
jgi:hypothetical protein